MSMCGFSLNIPDEFAKSLSSRWLTLSTLLDFRLPVSSPVCTLFSLFLFWTFSFLLLSVHLFLIPSLSLFYHVYSDYISMNNHTGIVLLKLNMQFWGI